jgi:hypothetical protein
MSARHSAGLAAALPSEVVRSGPRPPDAEGETCRRQCFPHSHCEDPVWTLRRLPNSPYAYSPVSSPPSSQLLLPLLLNVPYAVTLPPYPPFRNPRPSARGAWGRDGRSSIPHAGHTRRAGCGADDSQFPSIAFSRHRMRNWGSHAHPISLPAMARRVRCGKGGSDRPRIPFAISAPCRKGNLGVLPLARARNPRVAQSRAGRR